MCMDNFTCIYVYVPCQKKAADLMGQELHMVMSCHVLLGIEPESCEGTANTLNYRTISPGTKLGFIQDLGAFKRKKAAKTCSFK